MSLDFKLKAEYKIGGENRQYILDKAVEYITSKNFAPWNTRRPTSFSIRQSWSN